jgi:hypothetical protein
MILRVCHNLDGMWGSGGALVLLCLRAIWSRMEGWGERYLLLQIKIVLTCLNLGMVVQGLPFHRLRNQMTRYQTWSRRAGLARLRGLRSRGFLFG